MKLKAMVREDFLALYDRLYYIHRQEQQAHWLDMAWDDDGFEHNEWVVMVWDDIGLSIPLLVRGYHFGQDLSRRLHDLTIAYR
jgi:hypothetical protein